MKRMFVFVVAVLFLVVMPLKAQYVKTGEILSLDYLWALLNIVFFSIFMVGYIYYKKNPTEWRPVVIGGLKNKEDTLIIFSQQSKDKEFSLVLGSQRRVRISGFWNTQHPGILVSILHHYDQEKAWVARFRGSDGLEEERYILQSCGNSVLRAWHILSIGASVLEGWNEKTDYVNFKVCYN
ncbi:MAG: hypothetical protein UR25_C0003G0175 [Candidatus Nomurabacteria bacterium GW2011_GWE1_32_28]|uniref:Uncharacterized protein n=1 Tax=Candidatus Nomurabacteria bacterium GW2011_GWF1_31_48 TaxID=1618767 RepID=A0A0G0BH75_9BACT|nr:MAG: hypothetical protein UR10_C0003G0174 [Candidatus Nomurabacteria bacterium GW2011_GWF2_30_133]KKP28814.1 MAG: hypothetical protein UR18_C0002G0226 [Candidatus Nomurabacteria bacterium GW2011_GWE2_31_40]KKP30392.1 MAG: hypothetical protein UR19_C0003G0228 [Candidatus Nomurabacteria bacterium GW2011_GWF1_31_48]KKP34919.1 MAG: hypothetical protein UR25_C0003G0175 [Candidatus Nomurabacteria bacterium GW2011_GWE1_32_28]HAS81010.1 hypothetical protein [Candidatus Nomurabacteria bacterium]